MISNTPNSTRSSSRASGWSDFTATLLFGTLVLINSSVSHVGYYLSPFGYRVAATVILLAAAVLLLRGLSGLRMSWADDPVLVALLVWVMLILVRGIPPDQVINGRFITWAPLPLIYLAARSISERSVRIVVVAMVLLIPFFSWHLGQNRNEFSWAYLGYLTLLGLWVPRAIPYLLGGFGLFSGIYLDCHSAILAVLATLAYFRFRSWKAVAIGVAAAFVAMVVVERNVAEPFHFRDVLVKLALQSFEASPVIGEGLGRYRKITEGSRAGAEFEHAHCFPVTVLADTGLVGLAALALFLVAVWKVWPRLPLASRFVVIEYAVWSCFDEPLQWLSGWSVMILALTRVRDCEPEEQVVSPPL